MRKLILIIVAVLLVSGCEGEQGPTGPSGNANVRTGTISPTSEEWLWMGGYGFQTVTGTWVTYLTRYVNIPVTELTPEFISTGHVLVFFEAYPGTGKWTPLPFQFLASGAEYSYYITYEVMDGMIRLHYFYISNDTSWDVPDLQAAVIPTYTFKYMVIEGTALEAMMAREIDVSDHDQVTEYLTSR